MQERLKNIKVCILNKCNPLNKPTTADSLFEKMATRQSSTYTLEEFQEMLNKKDDGNSYRFV
jgi:hypothetical protein